MTEILPPTHSDTNDAAFWALLIGIDSYLSPNISTLRGAKNDVTAMRSHLMSQYLVPADHICMLIDTEATRAAIIAAFQDFLIGNTSIGPEDQILIQFCGHGSRCPNLTGTEPDGYDETIAPYDTRTPGIFDIPDKTLAALLAQLASLRRSNITVLFDCCHSGSGLRALPMPGAARVRQIAPDERPIPADLDAAIIAAATSRGISSAGWLAPGSPYVLLAACRDREMASELCIHADDQEEIWHGAFSYFVMHQLGQLSVGATYADLHERVAAQVNALYPQQMPQCEGDRGRVIFANIRYLRRPLFTAQPDEHNTVRLDGGYIHGLRKGTELAVYPPFTRSLTEASRVPLAILHVIAASATTSLARVSSPAAQAIPAHSKCVISRQSDLTLRQRVALQGHTPASEEADAAILTPVQVEALEELARMIHGDVSGYFPSPFLEIVSDPTLSADLYVVADSSGLSIYNASGCLLVRPEALSEEYTSHPNQARSRVVALLHALEHIARYRSVIALSNNDPLSELIGKVHVGLRRYRPGVPGSELMKAPAALGDGVTVTIDPEDEANNLYIVEITNSGSKPLYPYVFTLSPDYSIAKLYPGLHQEEALTPGHTAYLGLDSPTERLAFYLPPGWTRSQDYLKIIVTLTPTNLSLLEQGGVRVPPPTRSVDRSTAISQTPSSVLEELLEALMTGNQSRFMRKGRDPVSDDWATIELAITTIRGDTESHL